MTYLGIIFTFVFVNNVVLSQLLGLCPFIGASRDTESAVGMGFAVTFVASLSALATWAVYHGLLLPLDITYLQTVVFVLVVAGLVEFLEMMIRTSSPGLYRNLGMYLPHITANCAVLGITLVAVRNNYNALESFAAGFAAGAGFFLAVLLLSSLRDSLRREWIPKPFRGLPIIIISAGLMALAFMAFDKALLKNLVG